MKKFCIIANASKEKALLIVEDIIKYLQDKNCICVDATSFDIDEKDYGFVNVEKIPKNTECIIVLGGDGTIIRAAADIAEMDIPIVGINMGNLGYLADVEENELYSTLDALINGNYTLSERLMIKGIAYNKDSVICEGRVLNDIVVGRDGFSRIISLNIYVNGEFVETLRGDGVIIATPTGSTGYNLSAGGPVIKPNSNVLVITPICSHKMGSTSIVVSAQDVITIEVIPSKKTQEREAIASFDGSKGAKMGAGDILKICTSHYTTKMVNTGRYGYFEVLHKKLS